MIDKVRIFLLLFITTFFLAACLEEDPDSLHPSERFIKYFGTTGTESVVDLLETTSHEILILGYTNEPNGDFDYYLIKTDSAGNGIWQQSYNYSDTISDNVESSDIPTAARLINNDQNLLVIGTSDITDQLSIFMLNIEVSTGMVVDTFVYRYNDNRAGTVAENQGLKSTSGADVLYNESNNQYIILGSVATWSNDIYPNDEQSIFLMGVDATSFETEWVDFAGLRSEDSGIKLFSDGENYYYVASVNIPDNVSVGFGNKDIFISQFNPNSGVTINSEYYGTTGEDIVSNMAASDNFLFFTGTTSDAQSEDAFFLRVSKSVVKGDSSDFVTIDVQDGDLSLNGESNESASGSRGLDIVRRNNGKFFLVGQLSDYVSSNGDFKEDEIILFDLDGVGTLDVDNTRIYGSEDNDRANAIIIREDRSLIIGATVDFGSTSMISLLKTNSVGNF